MNTNLQQPFSVCLNLVSTPGLASPAPSFPSCHPGNSDIGPYCFSDTIKLEHSSVSCSAYQSCEDQNMGNWDNDAPALGDRIKDCQSRGHEENSLRQGLILKLTELKKCQTWLHQNKNPGPEIKPADQSMIEECEKQIKRYSDEVLALYRDLSNTRQSIILKLRDSVIELYRLRKEYLVPKLISWRYHQKASMIGVPAKEMDRTLDLLQQHFEWLADQALKIRIEAKTLLDHLDNPAVQDNGIVTMSTHLNKILEDLKNFLQSLILYSFLTSVQPPPVLKKDKTFSAEVRLLIGSKLGRYLSPKISARIIGAEDGTALKNGLISLQDILSKKSAGTIVGVGDQTLTFHEDKQLLSAKFDSMKISMDGRRAAKGPGKKDDTVANTKYCFLFTTKFLFGTPEDSMEVHIWTLSLPVVVTVHHSQDRDSHATIFWDYAFSNVLNDEVMDEVNWAMFADKLKWRFREFTKATRELSDADLNYLGEKLFGPTFRQGSQENLVVSRSKVFQEPMRRDGARGEQCNFPFWKWFYEIMDLIKTRLKDYWDEHMIYGLISKEDCAAKLRSASQPCLMIRFSDSTPGCVSLSFYQSDAVGLSSPDPVHLTPFNAKDLETMPLPERVSTCPSLQRVDYIYPDKEKSALLKYAKNHPIGTSKEGYAQAIMVMVVQDDNANADTDSMTANTPPIIPNHFSPADSMAENMEMNCDNNYGDMMTNLLSNASGNNSIQSPHSHQGPPPAHMHPSNAPSQQQHSLHQSQQMQQQTPQSIQNTDTTSSLMEGLEHIDLSQIDSMLDPYYLQQQSVSQHFGGGRGLGGQPQQLPQHQQMLHQQQQHQQGGMEMGGGMMGGMHPHQQHQQQVMSPGAVSLHGNEFHRPGTANSAIGMQSFNRS